jgi:dTDP-glucose pyrophosphorylase
MINIVIPIVNNNEFFKENFAVPKNLFPIGDKPLIRLVIDSFRSILTAENNIIFILKLDESIQFQTDLRIKELLPSAKFVYAHGNTAGSVASILLCLDLINFNYPLFLIGGDQIINLDIVPIVLQFTQSKSNYLLTFRTDINEFSADHPYSFARLNGDCIYYIEEKKSISNLALTGIYFFSNPSDFLNSSQNFILKNPEQENYYISQVVNLMIESGSIFYNYSIGEGDFVKYYKSKLTEGKNL